MKNLFVIILSYSSLVSVAVAQEDTLNIAACHAEDRDQERLNCYDLLSNYEATTEPIFENEVRWEFFEDSDAITGSDTSAVFLEASDLLNGRESPLFLGLRCDGEGGYEVFVGADGYIGGVRGRVPVTYRWGEDEPISERWSDSTNGTAAFLPRSYNDFMAGLREGGRLAFKWGDFRGNQYASVWNNVQLDEKAEFILRGCQLEN